MARDLVRILGPAGASSNVYTHASGDQPGMLLRTRRRSWDMVVEQPNVPLIDSEVNLMQQINQERIEDFIMSLALPGWLKASNYGDSTTAQLQYESASNSMMLREDSWVVANGKMIHVTHPTQPNQDASVTGGIRFSLEPVTGVGLYRTDLVFLEFWRHEISPFPASGTGAPGVDYYPTAVSPTNMAAEDPLSSQGTTRDQVLFEGGDIGVTVPNDLVSTAGTSLGTIAGPFHETSRRIQLRWRIRVVQDVDFATYKYGLANISGSGNPNILAQGGMMRDTAGITGKFFIEVPPEEGLGDLYLNNAEIYGKGRLFRAGDGSQADANALNTVDGYVFAMPMFMVNMGHNGPVEVSGVKAFTDMRQLSHVYIPNNVLHSDQLTTYDDVAQAGVYGAAFESTADPILGRVVKSNIRRNSITGGTGGDIAPNTITTFNLQTNSVDGTIILDDSINIKKLNLSSTGLPTIIGNNATGNDVTNGQIVVLEQNLALGYSRFSLATNLNTGPTATIGVVANYDVSGAEAPIVNGANGYIRLLGAVAKIWVSSAVSRGTSLMISTSAGIAMTADGTRDAFAVAINDATAVAAHFECQALLFERVPENSIRTSKIVDTSVTTAKLASQAVTLGKMAANSISRSQIIDGEVINAALASQVVTIDKMAANSVDDSKVVVSGISRIADNSITTAKLVDMNVTAGKIANHTITALQVAPGTITSTEIADGTIVATDLASDAITTIKITDLAVTTPKINDLAVVEGKIGAGAVTNTKIGAFAIDANKLAAGAVGRFDIIANAMINQVHLNGAIVGEANLIPGAVSATILRDGAVTQTKVAGSAIIDSHVLNVSGLKLIDGTVTGAKIAGSAINFGHIGLGQVRENHIGMRYVVQASMSSLDFSGNPTTLLSAAIPVPNSGTTGTNFTYVPWQLTGHAGNVVDGASIVSVNPSWAAGAPTQIVIRADGWYDVNGQAWWGKSSVPCYLATQALLTSGLSSYTIGAEAKYYPAMPSDSSIPGTTPANGPTAWGGIHSQTASGIVYCHVGDIIQLGVYESTGVGNTNTFTGNGTVGLYYCTLTLHRIGDNH